MVNGNGFSNGMCYFSGCNGGSISLEEEKKFMLCSVINTVKPFLVSVSICHQQFRALIDTGAEANCICVKVAELLKIPLKRKPPDFRLIGANNQSLSHSYDVNQPLVIVMKSSNGGLCSYDVEDLVALDDMPFDVILGTPFLTQHGFSIDVRRRMLSAGNFSFECIKMATKGDKAVSQLVRGEDSPGPVVIVDSLCLRSEEYGILNVQCSSNKSGGTCYFVPRDDINDEYIVDEGIVEGTSFRLPVMNVGTEPLVMEAGTVIGICKPIYWTSYARVAAATKDTGPVLPTLSPDIPATVLSEFERMLGDYRELFHNDFSVSSWNVPPMHIQLKPDASPGRRRAFRYTPEHLQQLKLLLAKYLHEKVIVESNSPWSSPAFFVPKSDGKLRLVIDYRYLNQCTVENRWPLPLIEDLLDKLGRSCVFSKFDAHSGFHQLPMAPDSEALTAFVTPLGLYQFKRMPMGLCNAPAEFSRAISQMTHDLPNVIAYMDDATVHSGGSKGESTVVIWHRHLDKVKEFLQRCKEDNLRLNGSKCVIGSSCMKFLGHIVSARGVSPDPDKVKKVKDMSPPVNIHELRTFLGMVNYYRLWIRDCASKQLALNKLLNKPNATPFIWTDDCQRDFDSLKESLTVEVVRAYPDPNVPYVLFTDASNYAIGAVLSQMDDDREWVIAYHSRALSRNEMKYPIHEKEALAVVDACKRFHHYLGSRHFTLYTDHHSLRTVMKWKDPPGRIARWVMTLQQYTFTAVYRAGKLNLNADAISRLCDKEELSKGKLTCREGVLQDEGMYEEEFMSLTSDPVNVCVSARARGHGPSVLESLGNRPIRFRTEEGSQELQVVDEWTDIYDNQTYLQCRNANSIDVEGGSSDEEWLTQEYVQEQMNDNRPDYPGIIPAMHHAFDKEFCEVVQNELPVLIHERVLLENEVEYIRDTNGVNFAYRRYVCAKTNEVYYQLILPSADTVSISMFIEECHNLCGHGGIDKTCQALIKRVFFAKLREKVALHIGRCTVCQERGKTNDPNTASYPIRNLPLVYMPNLRFSVDILGPIATSLNGNKYIIVAIDHFSKYVIADCLVDKSAELVSSFIVFKIYLVHGCPAVLLTDNGKEFVNSLDDFISKFLRIDHRKITAYHPQANGQVERINKVLADALSKLAGNDEHNIWDMFVPAVVHAYNISVNLTTGYTPYFLSHGRECSEWIDTKLPIPNELNSHGVSNSYLEYVEKIILSLNNVYDNVTKNIHHVQSMYNKPRKVQQLLKDIRVPQYSVNQEVLVYIPVIKNNQAKKFTRLWQGPYKITRKISDVVYMVSIKGKLKPFHISRIKGFNRTVN